MNDLKNIIIIKHSNYGISMFFVSIITFFRKLIEGTDLLKRLEDLPTFNERPKHDCRIKDCGEFDPDKSLSQ